MALRIDHLNKKIAALGDIELVKGDDYFYFVSSEGDQMGESVMVMRLNDMAESQWLEEAEARLVEAEEDADLEGEDEAKDDEAAEMSKVLAKYRSAYVRTTKADGRVSMDKGDEVAQALRDMKLGDVLALADIVTKSRFDTHANRYQSLNVGSQRMNAGNRIRAQIRKGVMGLQEALQILKESTDEMESGE